MVGEFFFGWWNNVCGGRGSAPDAWHSVRLPWVLCGRCEPEAVVRDGVVSCSGCKVSKVSPACLSAAFVSLACRFVLSINRSVHFLPRSSTLLRFYTRRIIIGRFRLRANCVVRCSPPTAAVVTERKSARSLFWSISSSSPPVFQSSAFSSFYLIFLLLR